MRNIIVQQSEDLVLQLPEGWAKEGEKVSIEAVDGGIRISKLIPVEVDIDETTFMGIAKLAHGKDITFNEMCIEILEEYIDEKHCD